ncbi:MAG: hypothetical protein AB1646_06260 [Thermodesulfobacteriota bacterium]
MITRVSTPIALVLTVILIVPALAGGTTEKRSTARGVAGSIYKSGATALDQTEGAVTACLTRTFNLFNPCLDLIKGCTGLVLAPIHGPLDYYAGVKAKPKAAKAEQKAKTTNADKGSPKKAK